MLMIKIFVTLFLFIMRLSALQVNLQKSRLASQLFQAKLQKDFFLGCVTEPYTVANKVVFRPIGYQVFPTATLEEVPRAALYVPRHINVVELGHLCVPDCSVIRLKWQGSDIVVVSGYLDIELAVISDWMENIIQYVRESRCKLLLTLDTNAHSSFYSSAQTNARGRQLEDFITRHMLNVANVGDVSTFQSEVGESIIDVTLYKDVEIWNWHVDIDFNASDHNSILFNIEVDTIPEREVRPWHQAKWRKFTDSLDKDRTLPDRMTCKKLDKEVDNLYKDINAALDLACPKYKVKRKGKDTDWYTDKIKSLHFRVKKQFRKFSVVQTEEEKTKYDQLRKKFRRRCRRAKALSWRKFVNETPNEHKMATLSRIALHKDKNLLNVLYKSDGSITAPGHETIDRLAEIHFPQATPFERFPGYSLDRAEQSSVIAEKYDEFLTAPIVRKSLLKFKPYKAPGPDAIKPIAFRYLPMKIFHFIMLIYKCCIHLRYTPKKWQEATVVFIPKAGKKDYREGKASRPIVLSNFFLKGLERVVTWRMDDRLKYYPIHPLQHGFQIGKGTEAALSNTCDYIEQFVLKRKYCLGVFLDISSAYDSMDIDHIRTSLYAHGGEEDYVEWYYQYLSHRVLHIPLHGDNRSVICSQGFPQGGVASAKFWIISFNPAIEIINRQFTVGNGYADDLSVVFGGSHPDDLVQRMQRVLEELVAWGDSCNLRFNPDKTVMVGFTRGRKHKFTLPLFIKGVPLKFQPTVKYLGLLLDSKLSWRPHILDKIALCKKYLLKMANIAHTTWGPKPHLMRWMYRCMVRTKFTYAAIVWAHAAQKKGIKTKLRRLNRIAINTYATVHRSSPSRALEILTDTFPLHLYLKKEAICAFVRLKDVLTLRWTGLDRRNPHIRSHLLHLQHYVRDCGIHDLITNVDTCDMVKPNSQFIVRVDSFGNRRGYVPYLETPCQVYTDGSKLQGRVGAAYVVFQGIQVIGQGSFRLPDNSTVYQAEIYAIKAASVFLLTQQIETDVVFFGDSQAALQALNSERIQSRVVLDAVRNLNLLEYVVNLVWVPAHSGIPGNEQVDALAKEATKLDYTTDMPLPKAVIKQTVLEHLRGIWDEEWQEYTEARMTKYFFPRQNKEKAKTACKLSRLQLGRYVRIITGHNNLRYYQSQLDITLSPQCRFCNSDFETFHHFIFECPSLHFSRQQIFLDNLPDTEENWKVKEVLEFSYLPHINRLLDPNNVHNIHLEDTDSEPEDDVEDEVDDVEIMNTD